MSDLKIVNDNGLLTVKETSDYLKVKVSTVYSWTYKGILPVVKLGGGRLNRYRKQDLDDFINKNLKGGSETLQKTSY